MEERRRVAALKREAEQAIRDKKKAERAKSARRDPTDANANSERRERVKST